MYIDNIIEAKNKLGISTVEMSRRSKLGLSEKTIARVLAKKTIPHLDTVLDIGETVGLSAMDLFADTKCFVGDPKLLEDLQRDIAILQAERDMLKKENFDLKIKLDLLKDDLIETQRNYIKLKNNN